LPDMLPLRGRVRMTAEIAILNKSAVALAANSAVTIDALAKHVEIIAQIRALPPLKGS
jgi:hypothetical protein